MSGKIIIYSQSLQNDDSPDLYFNGEYRTDFSAVPWQEIMLPLHKKQQQKTTRHESANVIYGIDSQGYYISVPSAERDVEGRLSLIEIVCPNDKKNQLPAAINEFLSKSGRTLSADIEQAINEILKKEYNPIKQQTQLILGCAFLMFLFFFIIYLFNGKD